MAGDMDAYRASFELYPSSSSRRRRRQRDPRSWSKRLLSILSLLFLIGVVAAVVFVIHKGSKTTDSGNQSAGNDAPDATNSTAADSTSSSGSGSSDANTTTSGGCVKRRPEPHQRTVAFWQSEVAGCEKIPSGVTHVVFGFALVDGATGHVVPTFQNTDEEIKSCVKALHGKCIATLGSIGGSTNNDAIANVTDSESFAASAMALVTKFGFDGVDIDDETVGPAFTASRVVSFVQATRAAFDKTDKTLLLTYDAYFNEGEPSFCTNSAFASYTRCFPTELLPSLDWINIMAYNVAESEATATEIYEKALNATFVEWKTQLDGDLTKATIGVCVEKSCAYGPGPSEEVIASWKAFARGSGGGGMMVYAASGEVAEDFSVTRSLLPPSLP